VPCGLVTQSIPKKKQTRTITTTATAKKKTVQNNLRTWKDKKIRFLPAVSYDTDEVRNLCHPLCCKACQQLHGFSDRRRILTKKSADDFSYNYSLRWSFHSGGILK